VWWNLVKFGGMGVVPFHHIDYSETYYIGLVYWIGGIVGLVELLV
jgi:hypothetical protein